MSSLEQAPDHVKLAVDLILLLEQQNLPAATLLAALKLVVKDTENKLAGALE
ncbi:DUF2496 domain-containing protein [Alishewanella sp. 16-MA]|uniref:DUF2496 domain-containing protein n=1 Tax=Alishewanella maricola TaxID=2795740 RepID=A0ABS8C021_9ALTE|nr:DUF2496 domain-containing protein [Alishewanella maricola]MCB5225661.1 DUF2496 domain-containing protein [Alishewanella maricola]